MKAVKELRRNARGWASRPASSGRCQPAEVMVRIFVVDDDASFSAGLPGLQNFAPIPQRVGFWVVSCFVAEPAMPGDRKVVIVIFEAERVIRFERGHRRRLGFAICAEGKAPTL